MSSEVFLIARREIAAQVRTKSFVIGNLITLLVVVGGIIAYAAFSGGGHHEEHTTIGLTRQTQVFEEPLRRAAMSQGITIRTTPTGPEQATADIDNGTIDIALMLINNKFQVVTRDGLSSTMRAVFDIAITRNAVAKYIEHHPEAAPEFFQNASRAVEVSAVHPSDSTQGQRWFVAYCGVIVMFFSIFQYGMSVATGVIEEKSSRVVELLLSTIRPVQLLVGKIAGIGAVGLLQTVLIGGAALATGAATGVITIGATAPLILGATVLWFLLGYLFAATLYAATGSMVSRQEDGRSATTPVNILLIASFYLAAFGAHGGGPVIDAFSWIPPFSAFLMPIRVAQSDVGPAAFVGATLVMLAATAALAVLGARIYERSVLRMGAKVSWRHALAEPV